MPCCAGWRARSDRISRSSSPTMARRRTPPTLLKSWQARLQQPLMHVWQEHRGFRAAEIRNRAILASSGAYCIFLDGDCIPRSDFVQEHRAARRDRLARRRQSRADVRAADRAGLDDGISSRSFGRSREALPRPLQRRHQSASRRCCRRSSGRCGSSGRNTGGARARAIWRSGAPTSIGWMASTAAMSAGVSRTPTC